MIAIDVVASVPALPLKAVLLVMAKVERVVPAVHVGVIVEVTVTHCCCLLAVDNVAKTDARMKAVKVPVKTVADLRVSVYAV